MLLRLVKHVTAMIQNKPLSLLNAFFLFDP